MIAELFPEFYDVQGRKVLRPGGSQRRSGFRPTFPMGRNLTQPLKYKCSNFTEMRKFLAACRYRSGRLEKRHYWQPPEEFEETKTGNCVDFALWTWRQLVGMGYPARFVVGKAGKFGEGHAWVTFEKDGKFHLLEPQMWPVGLRMPRISTLRYHPATSVACDRDKLSYYVHEKRDSDLALRMLPALVREWLSIWIRFWIRTITKIVLGVSRRIFSGTPKRQSSERPE